MPRGVRGEGHGGIAARDWTSTGTRRRRPSRSGKELYLFLPGGVGRSKLAGDLAKDKAAVGTMRNWRTVTKLLEMADAL